MLPHQYWIAVLGATAVVALVSLLSALSRKGRTEDQARAYLAGFTYVLSDDPDAAIAELSKVAQLNTQTLETYFALGALFRRKGELDRAIRLHQNMLLRPGLAPETRRRAQLALALDYRNSALNDLAAEMFEKLLAEEPTNKDAIVHYRHLLEESGKWGRAIELQARLVKLEGKGEDVLAHLLASVARSMLAAEPKESLAMAERAVALDPSSADAQLALGEARLSNDQPAAAAEPLRRALELEPELAVRSLNLLSKALGHQREVAAFFLEQIAHRGDRGIPFELAFALHLRDQGHVDEAVERLKKLVERHPRFWDARKELGSLLLAHDRSEDLRADYQEILRTLGQPAMVFRCQACRQLLPEYLFRCPSCHAWGGVNREENPPARERSEFDRGSVGA